MSVTRLSEAFFRRDCLEVAPALIGRLLAVRHGDAVVRVRITETEAYRGEEDTACHAHKGRTPRTEVLYAPGGIAYAAQEDIERQWRYILTR